MYDAADGAVGTSVFDILARHEHDTHSMRAELVTGGRIREPSACTPQCRGRLRPGASTDLCSSLVADVLLPRAASEEDCLHGLRALVRPADPSQDLPVPMIAVTPFGGDISMPIEGHRGLSGASSAGVGIDEEVQHGWSRGTASNVLDCAAACVRLTLLLAVLTTIEAPILS